MSTVVTVNGDVVKISFRPEFRDIQNKISVPRNEPKVITYLDLGLFCILFLVNRSTVVNHYLTV